MNDLLTNLSNYNRCLIYVVKNNYISYIQIKLKSSKIIYNIKLLNSDNLIDVCLNTQSKILSILIEKVDKNELNNENETTLIKDIEISVLLNAIYKIKRIIKYYRFSYFNI